MKMTCTLEFCNEISSEKRAEFLSQLTALGMSVSSAGGTFNFRCEEKYDEYLDISDAVTTPPQMKMMSNPHMMCMHHMCKRTGGHYKLNEFPRKRYCVEHKPDDTYKTHQVFRREAAVAAASLHHPLPLPLPCFSDDSSSEKRKRDKDEDDDGWITIKR